MPGQHRKVGRLTLTAGGSSTPFATLLPIVHPFAAWTFMASARRPQGLLLGMVL